MPKLDERLKCVARLIRSAVHVDVGSDHAKLLVALIKAGRIQRGIAVENKVTPWTSSRVALEGLPAEARFGDGLSVFARNEADSLSICGMGAKTIVRILSAHPQRIPSRVVIQPNRNAELVRTWAANNGLHFVDEQISPGHWDYRIMCFQRVQHDGPDPAYEGLDRDAALLFGPTVMKKHTEQLQKQLLEEKKYMENLTRLSESSQQRLATISQTLSQL